MSTQPGGRDRRPRRPAPPPAESDVVAVVAVGLVVWAVALGVGVAAHGRLSQSGHGDWVWIFAAGVFLGLIGIRHVLVRRSALHKSSVDDPTAETAGPNTL